MVLAWMDVQDSKFLKRLRTQDEEEDDYLCTSVVCTEESVEKPGSTVYVGDQQDYRPSSLSTSRNNLARSRH